MPITAWEATPHSNDGYHIIPYEEERKYINEYPPHLHSYVESICREYLVPIQYLYRLHYIESKLGTRNIRHENNGTTSIGFGQLNTGSFEYFQDKYNDGRYFNPHNEKDNIRISAMYFRDLYERFDGDWISAGIAYNWGVGNLHSDKEIPWQSFEYAMTIVFGKWFAKDVQIIKGAVAGIL